MAKHSKPPTKVTSQDSGEQLWRLAESMRHSGERFSLAALIAKAQEQAISVDWQDLFSLAARQQRHGVLILPPYVINFLIKYLSGRKVRRVLDPSAGSGSFLIPLVRALDIPEAVGVVRTAEELVIARAMSHGVAIVWNPGHTEQATDSQSGDFDLIASSPPLGLPSVNKMLKSGTGSLLVRGSGTYVSALESMQHLSDQGEAIFIFPNGFFFNADAASVRNAMSQLGLFVNAVIALPPGAFSPHTSIELNLVFISRQETPQLFVGRLGLEQDPAALLANLKKRRTGPAPELGQLVPIEKYRGWHAFIAEEEKARLVERSGLAPVPLNELVEAVNLGKQTEDGGFVSLPNCVYLPLIGTSPAVTSLSDLRIKPQNYAQLVMRGDKIYTEFLAGFFNSPLGRKARESMLSGSFIPKITKQTILLATVYVLSLEQQKRATDVGREIQELRLRLEQLDRDLWYRPGEADKVRKAVGALTQEESFESWLEMLPFPLASILWRYQAAAKAEHKVQHLLNYFEAAVQFLGTLMTSAFHSNQPFFTEHRRDWFEAGKDNPHSLARSSFGEWVVRCQRLAKTTRQLLSNKEDRELCLDMYRTTDSAKLEAIANKGVYSVLETVGRYRNDWKGHTGIVSAKEDSKRLSLLQEELTRLRGLLGGAFEDWALIRPGRSSYTAGVYRYSAKRLMGSRQIFKEEKLDTTEVMDAAELYFFDATSRRPLQLLHFFRMMSVPESEEVACYFFNRLEKANIRWVSYHFEGQAERIEPDTSVLKLIEEVEQNGGE